MGYKCVYMLSEIKEYLKNTVLFAFDFETSPRDKWRNDNSAALDAHKADITGISFSVSEGTAIYVPLKHRSGRNAENQAAIWDYLKLLFESKDVIKVAHNLAFESMFLYARGIVLQKPCYDTIAASQLTLKSKWEFRSLADSGLKTLAPALCKAEMTEFSTVTEGRFFDELNPQDEKTVRYACTDSDYTLRLYHVFNQWFDRFLPKHRTIVEEVESPTSQPPVKLEILILLEYRFPMLKPVAITCHVEQLTLVHKSVKHGRCNDWITQKFSPFLEVLIGRQNHRGLLI
jgi:DNA polymerase-1